MSSGRVIVRACWGGTCAMDGWNRRGRCLVAPRIDVDRGAKRRGGAGRAPWKGDELTRPVHARVEDRG